MFKNILQWQKVAILVMKNQSLMIILTTMMTNKKLYFPLAEERNKWKMFSHTPLGPGPEGLFFESHAQCLSVAVLLSAIADVYF